MHGLSAFKILFSSLCFSVTQFCSSYIWQTMLLFLLWILYWNVTGKFEKELKMAVTLGEWLKLSTPSLSPDQELVQAHRGKKHCIDGGTSILIFCCPVTFVPWEVSRVLPHIYCPAAEVISTLSLSTLSPPESCCPCSWGDWVVFEPPLDHHIVQGCMLPWIKTE